MRVVIDSNRRAKVAQDGLISNLVSPGAGSTGLFGNIGQGLGFVAGLQGLKRPELEEKAIAAGVEAQKDIFERIATDPERSRMALDQALLKAQKSEQEDASTLAELIDSGMSPEKAHEVLSKNRMDRESQVSNLLMMEDQAMNAQNLAQKQLTDAAYGDLRAAQLAQEQYDIMGKKEAQREGMFDLGTQLMGMEDFFNPQASGVKSAERGYKHGGITPGPHDHSVLNLIIAHEDGTPALDADGDEMHVTGSEAIIPDYIFDELMAAAKAGDKNALYEIFMDEIATEERFQG